MKNAPLALGVFGLALSTGCAADLEQMELIEAQRAAHEAWSYTMGDEALAPSDFFLRDRLLELREALVSEQTRIHRNTSTTIRGLPSAVCEVYGTSARHEDVVDLVDEIAADLGRRVPYADEFFVATRGQKVIDGRLTVFRGIDPEPAVLVNSLAGGQGVAAAAYYATSHIETTVRKWPGSWSACSASCPEAARPCSTTDLPAGTTATMTIQKVGSMYRCI